MKKLILIIALAVGVTGAKAQTEKDSVVTQNTKLTLTKDVYSHLEENGDLFQGLTRRIGFDRMIAPHGLEVTYDKTVHVIFPSAVKYVDLGSPNLIAGKADGAENVVRVKSTTKEFRGETNMSVITDNGNFYTFNVRYADEPLMLSVEMVDFIHDGSEVNRPNNALDVYLTELGSESPKLVNIINKSIYKNNDRRIRHIGSKSFGVHYLLKGLYTHNGLLYFHTEVRNNSNVPYDIDFITFKIVDKKVAKRTAIGEQVIFPLRAYNYAVRIAGRDTERTVYTMNKFTIPNDKQLIVEMHEKSGGRHQSFIIDSEDIEQAELINELRVW